MTESLNRQENGGKGESILSQSVYRGNKMNTKQPQTEDGFKSGFKAWIRIVAFVIVAVFLPEQFAQAIEYDPRVLWRGAKAGILTPTSMVQNVPTMDIPLAVKAILTDLSGKQVSAIRFSSDLTVKLDKPLNLSKEKIEEIYSWLKGRPCGSKALYDLLAYKGIRVEEQDIAVMALSIDILNDVVKPEGNPEVIKNSLFALSKASEFFGLKLYPVKINPEDLANNTPFIAHLNGDHYVLVTKVADGKVYITDEHKEDYLPAEKFLQEFSGYSLVAKADSQAVLSDKEAQSIMGARSRRGDDFDWGAWATNMGIMVGTSVVLSGIQWGSTVNQGGTIANGAAHVAGNLYYQMPNMASVGQGLTNALITYNVSKAVVNVGQMAGWNPTTTRIVGDAISGAAIGSVGGVGTFIHGSSAITNMANLSLKGAITGAASGLVYGGVSELARKQGASDSIASLAGSIPMMFTAGALNQGSLSGGMDQITGKNFTSYILPNIITVGAEEILRRTTNIDPAYNSMIGAGIRAGMSSYLGGSDSTGMNVTINQAITRGLVEGGLSYATAGFEKTLNFNNPFMESFVASTLTAGVRGIFTNDGVIGSITKNWQDAGLRTLTIGYYNHDPSFAGEAAYFGNLLDWSQNAARSGFSQAMVQYGTDTYHYTAVSNLMQTMQFSPTLANMMGLPLAWQTNSDKKFPGLLSLNKFPNSNLLGQDPLSLLDPNNPLNKSPFDQLKEDLKGKGLFRDFGDNNDSDLAAALLKGDNKKPEDLINTDNSVKSPTSDVAKDVIKNGIMQEKFGIDTFNILPDSGIKSNAEIIIKAGSELLINPKTGEILPGSKITGWDIKSLTEYPDSLKVLVSTYETVNGASIVPTGMEKLGALVSSYNNDVGVSAALLQMKAKAGNMIQVDGRSLYVKDGNIQFNSTEAQQLAGGISTAKINNYTYQYTPQINYLLDKFSKATTENVQSAISQVKNPAEIPNTYRAFNVAPTIVKMMMQGPQDSFAVGSFGAYMKPGDTIYGAASDHLTGIGATDAQKAKLVLAGAQGYKVAINPQGEFLLKGAGIIAYTNESFKKYGGFAYRNDVTDRVINNAVIGKTTKEGQINNATTFRDITLASGEKVSVAGIEARDNRFYGVGDVEQKITSTLISNRGSVTDVASGITKNNDDAIQGALTRTSKSTDALMVPVLAIKGAPSAENFAAIKNGQSMFVNKEVTVVKQGEIKLTNITVRPEGEDWKIEDLTAYAITGKISKNVYGENKDSALLATEITPKELKVSENGLLSSAAIIGKGTDWQPGLDIFKNSEKVPVDSLMTTAASKIPTFAELTTPQAGGVLFSTVAEKDQLVLSLNPIGETELYYKSEGSQLRVNPSANLVSATNINKPSLKVEEYALIHPVDNKEGTIEFKKAATNDNVVPHYADLAKDIYYHSEQGVVSNISNIKDANVALKYYGQKIPDISGTRFVGDETMITVDKDSSHLLDKTGTAIADITGWGANKIVDKNTHNTLGIIDEGFTVATIDNSRLSLSAKESDLLKEKFLIGGIPEGDKLVSFIRARWDVTSIVLDKKGTDILDKFGKSAKIVSPSWQAEVTNLGNNDKGQRELTIGGKIGSPATLFIYHEGYSTEGEGSINLTSSIGEGNGTLTYSADTAHQFLKDLLAPLRNDGKTYVFYKNGEQMLFTKHGFIKASDWMQKYGNKGVDNNGKFFAISFEESMKGGELKAIPIASNEIKSESPNTWTGIRQPWLRNILGLSNASVYIPGENGGWKQVKVENRAIYVLAENKGTLIEKAGGLSGSSEDDNKIRIFNDVHFRKDINDGLSVRNIYTIIGNDGTGKGKTFYIDGDSITPLFSIYSHDYPQLTALSAQMSDNDAYTHALVRKVALIPPAVVLTAADFVFFSKGVASSNFWVGAGLLTASAASSLGAEELYKYAITGEHISFKEGATNVGVSVLTGGLGRVGKLVGVAAKGAQLGEEAMASAKTLNLLDESTKILGNTMREGGLIAKTNYTVDNVTSIIATGKPADIKESAISVAQGYGLYAAFNTAGTLAKFNQVTNLGEGANYVLAKGFGGSAYNVATGFYTGDIKSNQDLIKYAGTGFAAGLTSGWIKNPIAFAAASNLVGSGLRQAYTGGFSSGEKAAESLKNMGVDTAVGVAEGVVWAGRGNIGKFLDAKPSIVIGLRNQAAIIGAGGTVLGVGRDLLNGQLNAQSTPGQFTTSFIKGAFTAEVLTYGFRQNGLQYQVYSKDGILNRLATFSDGAVLQKRMLVGAAEWPLVTYTMGVATPVWNSAFGRLEHGVDSAVDNIFKTNFADRQANPLSNTVTSNQNQAVVLLQSIKSGLYMGPAIYLLSRPAETPAAGSLANTIELTKNAALNTSVGRTASAVYNADVFSTMVGGKAITRGLIDQTWVDAGANLSLAKIGSLVYVAGFVTGVERGLKSIEKVGSYVDIASSRSIAASYPGYNEYERGGLSWGLLFKQSRNVLDSERIQAPSINKTSGIDAEKAPTVAVKTVDRGLLHDKDVQLTRQTVPGQQVEMVMLTDEAIGQAHQFGQNLPSGTYIVDSTGMVFKMEGTFMVSVRDNATI